MLQLKLPKIRLFKEATEEYVYYEPLTVKLEHSLISIQRWESKWHKSFLSAESLTQEELFDYIRCMSLNPDIDPTFVSRLTPDDFNKIREYMNEPMTATVIHRSKPRGGRPPIITAELIYYWMTAYNIPFECSKWHIKQLLTLVEVCSVKSNPGGKTRGTAAERAAMNKARRAKTGSKG